MILIIYQTSNYYKKSKNVRGYSKIENKSNKDQIEKKSETIQ